MEQPKNKRTLIYSIASFFIVAAIATLTVVIFKALEPVEEQAPTTSTAQSLNEVDTPEQLLADYSAASIKSRDELYQVVTLSDEKTVTAEPDTTNLTTSQGPTNTAITYAKADRFAIQTTAADAIQFMRKDSAIKDNDASLKTATESFLTEKGFTKGKVTTVATISSNSSFDSKNVVCEISDIAAFEKQPATFGLSCTTKQAIDAQYELIDTFAKLTTEMNTSTTSLVTTSVPITKDTMQLQSVIVTGEQSANTYYFATLDKEWEYIGTRPVTNPDDEASFAIPDKLKKAISDSKWNGFLETYVK